jgi:holliday junction DNA helicase RuvA
MLGFISGKIIGSLMGDAIIKTPSGLGYIVQLPPNDRILINDNIEVFVLHVVREDDERLYGFHDLSDREWVEKLLKVNGVGPKVAATIVYALGWRTLQTAIVSEDFKTLAGVKGLGAKTAKKIVLELKGASTDISSMSEKILDMKDPTVTDFTNALTNMGYKKPEVVQVISSLKQDNEWDASDLQSMIKKALRSLAGR